MPKVELIYDLDCPNVPAARKALVQAFAACGLQPSWTEWDRNSSESPEHVSGFGSPTVLVDGRDVAGSDRASASDCCRVYEDQGNRLTGVPPVSLVAAALCGLEPGTRDGRGGTGWLRSMVPLPGVGAALLPVGACPACWPAYGGVVSSLGLGFLLKTTYMLPITAAFFGLALFALAYRADTRRGYAPFILGTVSAALAIVFKFAYAVAPAAYLGLAGLVAASLWNAWPRASSATGSCPDCVLQRQGNIAQS